jgi:hypothetical protein
VKTLLIQDLDDHGGDVSDGTECTLAEFCADNAEMDQEDLSAVAALRDGESLEMGGGAAPWILVTAHVDDCINCEAYRSDVNRCPVSVARGSADCSERVMQIGRSK